MEELEYEKQKLRKVEDELKIVKEGEEKILKELPKKYGNNPVLLANLMSSTATKISNIARIKEKPYFARIDFKEDGKSINEKLYIGKIGVIDLDGKIIVTDWRAPVSTLYYDSNLGNVEYNAPDGKIHGTMSLKRQIIIENENIKSIYDVDSVSDDELLKPYLGASADSRLKNIVASIQGEQNNIIRKSIEKNLIVQGVAGSGKTTVALHRIAYLMYNNSDKYKANQFMVIGPNKFFINYISNVLPDLDASNAVQLTYEELATQYTKEKLVFEDSTRKIADITEGKINNPYSKFKSSIEYKRLLDRYLNNIENRLVSDDGLIINNIKVLEKDFIMNIYKETIGESIAQRLELTAKIVANRIKNDDIIYNKIKDKMFEIERKQPDIESKRKIAKKEIEMLKDLTNHGFEKQIKKYLDISSIKAINLYKDFVNNVDKLYNKDIIDVKELQMNTINSLNNKIVENEDIAPIMYIKLILFGNDEFKNIKCVVVDEAQDFGLFSFIVLRKILSNAIFSIFGDMAQGIYSYRAIENWNEIKNNVFEGSEYIELKKSYRTSIEIMNEANKISEPIGFGRANPVIRNSGPIIKTKINKIHKKEYISNRVKEYLEKGYKSIAIIYKNQEKMLDLNKYFKEQGIESEIIYKDQKNYNGGVCILTSYLSKGLEFDVVIVADCDEENYNHENILDMKLLYVSMTRALHKLELVYENNICKYLKE